MPTRASWCCARGERPGKLDMMGASTRASWRAIGPSGARPGRTCLHRPELRLPCPWPPPGPRCPPWLPGCPGGLHRPEPRLPGPGGPPPAQGARRGCPVASTGPSPACPVLARSSQDQPSGLSRLLPLRLSVVPRPVRGRLRWLGRAGLAASGCPAASSAGSRAHVPLSQFFNTNEASKGIIPTPFAASSSIARASAVRYRSKYAAAETRTSMRGCVNSTVSALRPASPCATNLSNAAMYLLACLLPVFESPFQIESVCAATFSANSATSFSISVTRYLRQCS